MTRSALTRAAVFLLVTMLVAVHVIVRSDAVVRFATVSAPGGFSH